MAQKLSPVLLTRRFFHDKFLRHFSAYMRRTFFCFVSLLLITKLRCILSLVYNDNYIDETLKLARVYAPSGLAVEETSVWESLYILIVITEENPEKSLLYYHSVNFTFLLLFAWILALASRGFNTNHSVFLVVTTFTKFSFIYLSLSISYSILLHYIYSMDSLNY